VDQNALCTCGSGLALAACCLRPCGDLTAPGPATGYSHPKCYARELSNCSCTISGEHWVSESLLYLFAPDGAIRLRGLSGMNDWRRTSPGRLKSRVLCSRHNNLLSPLDQLTTRFFASLGDFGSPLHPHRPMHSFRGFDLERCFLKMMCGAISAGVLKLKDRSTWRPDGAILRALIGGVPLQRPCGLSVWRRKEEGDQKIPLGMRGFSKGGEVYGFHLVTPWTDFVLAIRPDAVVVPNASVAEGCYRPALMEIGGAKPTTLALCWD
jgi:hypothetical protein